VDGRSDTGTDNPIPLPNVSSKILAKVIEYCKYRVDVTKEDKPTISEEEKKQWDSDFVKVDQATLFELILVRVYDVICALLSNRSVVFLFSVPVLCSCFVCSGLTISCAKLFNGSSTLYCRLRTT